MLPVKSSDPRLAYVGVKITSDDGDKQLTEDDLGEKKLLTQESLVGLATRRFLLMRIDAHRCA